jgi:hypothetical protein
MCIARRIGTMTRSCARTLHQQQAEHHGASALEQILMAPLLQADHL